MVTRGFGKKMFPVDGQDTKMWLMVLFGAPGPQKGHGRYVGWFRAAFRTLHRRDATGVRSFFSALEKANHRSGNHVVYSITHLDCVLDKVMGLAAAAVVRRLRAEPLSPVESG